MKKIIFVSLLFYFIAVLPFAYAILTALLIESVTDAHALNSWNTRVGATWAIALNSIDGDTTYGSTPSATNNLVMDMTNDISAGSIDNVTIIATCRLTACAGTCGEGGNVRITVNSIFYNGGTSAQDWTTSYANYTDFWTTNPETGTSWAWSDIAGLATDILSTKSGSEATDWRCTYIEMGVYYRPTLDTTFLLMMPLQYSGANYNFTSDGAEGNATTTSFISFNFTLSDLGGPLVEPQVLGATADKQQGSLRPIFLIDNVGNIEISIGLRINETQPGQIRVFVNALS